MPKNTFDPKPLTKALLDSYRSLGLINAGKHAVFPSINEIQDILTHFKEVLFPGFIGIAMNEIDNIEDTTQHLITYLYRSLSKAIFSCLVWEDQTKDPQKKSETVAISLLNKIPTLRETLIKDANAIYQGDPAANSLMDIVLSYPGFQGILVHRIAHELFLDKIPLIPRIMSEIAHSDTGIDIHPGASIGNEFCIDHGTGIVIGETATIGNNVKLYQGVTLGAFSIKKSAGNKKRHPTLKDNVTVYARSTILGGDTIIGKNCVVGGNVWLTRSMKDNSTIYVSMNDKQIIKPHSE